MTTSEFLNDIQKRIDGKRSRICIQGFEDETNFAQMSLKEFINAFLSKYCKYYTIYYNTKSPHCPPARRRSVSDIYRLCKFYFVNVTLEEVMLCLAHLEKEQKIGYFYCNTTHCRVWMDYAYWKTHTVNPFKYHEPDEFNISTAIITELANIKY